MHVARKEQLKKLWDRHAFTPVLKEEVPRGAQVFGHKWVNKNSRGRYKSRFICADVKARYTKEQEAEMNVFVPTPTAESHAVLEVYICFVERLHDDITRHRRSVPHWRGSWGQQRKLGVCAYTSGMARTVPRAACNTATSCQVSLLGSVPGCSLRKALWEKDRRISLPERASRHFLFAEEFPSHCEVQGARRSGLRTPS